MITMTTKLVTPPAIGRRARNRLRGVIIGEFTSNGVDLRIALLLLGHRMPCNGCSPVPRLRVPGHAVVLSVILAGAGNWAHSVAPSPMGLHVLSDLLGNREALLVDGVVVVVGEVVEEVVLGSGHGRECGVELVSTELVVRHARLRLDRGQVARLRCHRCPCGRSFAHQRRRLCSSSHVAAAMEIHQLLHALSRQTMLCEQVCWIFFTQDFSQVDASGAHRLLDP